MDSCESKNKIIILFFINYYFYIRVLPFLKNGAIVHKQSGLCIDITNVKSGEFAKVQKCSDKSGQIWEFKNYEK